MNDNINCGSFSYDNREACPTCLPSGCIPYTGYVADSIKDTLPCRPNVNDVLKSLQNLIDSIKASVGDPADFESCIDLPDNPTFSQIIATFFSELCAIKTILADLPDTPDPTTITMAIDLLCLLDPSCDPQTTYSIDTIIRKLVLAVCNLTTRVQTIEDTLNL